MVWGTPAFLVGPSHLCSAVLSAQAAVSRVQKWQKNLIAYLFSKLTDQDGTTEGKAGF